jgi:murein DD-endopeptidase MepM/ murein hydrolase activator NlpD
MSGWDVAELQFLLAWHGFPSARLNGTFSAHVAAAPGRVSWAARRSGGWGNLIVIQGRDHTALFYAHLSRIDTALGQKVTAGQPIGLVGSTGNSTGPHLYLEVRVNTATVDPLPALEPRPRPAPKTAP